MAYLSRYVDRTYHEMRNRSLSYVGSDRHLFITPVGEIAAKAITIGEVGQHPGSRRGSWRSTRSAP